METDTKSIIFNFPGDVTSADIIEQILLTSGLGENEEEFSEKDAKGIEPRFIIVRDTAYAMIGKKIPEEKMVEILAKHLETSKETAQKIIQDINEKIVPFARTTSSDSEAEKSRVVVPQEKPTTYDKEKYKQELLNKIRSNKSSIAAPKEAPAMPYKKTPDIVDVEDNAKNMEKTKPIKIPDNQKIEKSTIPTPPKQTDPYKESVE